MEKTQRSAGRTRGGMLLAVSIVVATLAACGSGGSPSAAASTVNIGLPHPLTGVWAEGGQNSLDGALLAIDDINAAGGVKALGGAKLKGISADTSSSDPGQAASVTRKLVQQNDVRALVGAYVSALTLTASTEAEKAGVPMLTQAFTDELTSRGYKYIFELPPASSVIGAATVPQIRDAFAESGKRIQRVMVISSNDAALQAQAKATAAAAQGAGLTILGTELYPIDLTDASVLAQKAATAKPDLVFLGGPLSASILVVQNLRSLGYSGPVVGLGGGGILDKGFGQALGPAVNGVLSMAAWNWDLPYKGIDDVNKRFAKRFNQPFMPQEAGESYAAVWVIKDAMEKARSSKPADIAKTLRTLTLTEGPGSWMPGGKVSFDAKGLNPAVAPIVIQWQDGVPKTVWPKSLQQAKPLG